MNPFAQYQIAAFRLHLANGSKYGNPRPDQCSKLAEREREARKTLAKQTPGSSGWLNRVTEKSKNDSN